MAKYRSDCPLSRMLDVVGDKWTLLVLRDIVAFRKSTFKELSGMEEGIASNILADRLRKLVKDGFLTKSRSRSNKLVYHYTPTKKSLDLMPMVSAMKSWSEKHLYKKGEKPTPVKLFK